MDTDHDSGRLNHDPAAHYEETGDPGGHDEQAGHRVHVAADYFR